LSADTFDVEVLSESAGAIAPPGRGGDLTPAEATIALSVHHRRLRQPNEKGLSKRSELAVTLLSLVSASAAYLFLKWLLFQDAQESPLIAIYGAVVTAYLVSRVVAAHRYSHIEMTAKEVPTVAFIVPVKNEGLMIGVTLRGLFEADYPRDRFEVVVINDGSSDETALMLRLSEFVYPNLRIITLPENLGKRHAMAAGIRASDSDIVVVIDSDTVVEKEAVALLVRSFNDPSIAAVSGLTQILNEDANILTQVQAFIYEVSFRIHKSAEALMSSVTCCPGCFSAYRRDCITPLLAEWSTQTFLGRPTIFGDDRALTMLLLRDGWNVRYDSEAVAHTEAPVRLRGYLRQQLRWKKSWIQQGLRASRFMWRRPLLSAMWFYTGFALSFVGPHILLRAFVVGPIAHHAFPWRLLSGTFTVGLLFASYLSLKRRDVKRLRSILVFPLVALVLTLQMPFAIAKLADSTWGTR
jgi:hyaluronan synthase